MNIYIPCIQHGYLQRENKKGEQERLVPKIVVILHLSHFSCKNTIDYNISAKGEVEHVSLIGAYWFNEIGLQAQNLYKMQFQESLKQNAQKCKDGNFKNLPKRKSLGTTFFFFSGEKEFLFFKKEKSLKTILF